MPSVSCPLYFPTVAPDGGVSRRLAFRHIQGNELTSQITMDQWKLVSIEGSDARKWGHLVIFNRRSIEVTGFNGCSMVLTGCNEDQSTGSRKWLIVTVPDK